ncbi:hypothetical protein SAMN05421770_1013 [Granulicella rosea]|uniref:Uncharacterized protein n=1 Tax=Granulicella rosea TaxID=474952 RepID=A0A239CM76_9BACT|nr:hypothetical protein [Granulicella rosea]SNS21220.1 hypothetical protein SAMN05421770_1013 [Granulicella rosea]
MSTALRSDEKRLNEMNRLSDMGHFPAMVNAGATFNVLATIAATWWVEARWPALAGAWVAAVLAVNLLPVVLLRLTIGPRTVYPRLAEMDFFRDQHKFSDWVYVAASADMAFWVLLTWTAAALDRRHIVLEALLAISALATFSPVILRVMRGRR